MTMCLLAECPIGHFLQPTETESQCLQPNKEPRYLLPNKETVLINATITPQVWIKMISVMVKYSDCLMGELNVMVCYSLWY